MDAAIKYIDEKADDTDSNLDDVFHDLKVRMRLEERINPKPVDPNPMNHERQRPRTKDPTAIGTKAWNRIRKHRREETIMQDNIKLKPLMIGLDAIASTLNTYNDIDAVDHMYELVRESLQTEHEKKALQQGTLAICARVGKMRVREKLHIRSFKRACRQVRAS